MEHHGAKLNRRALLAGGALAFTTFGEGQTADRQSGTDRPRLSLLDVGEGINRTVTLQSDGLFRLRFSSGDNWGLDQWFDLVSDPGGQIDLLAPEPGDRKPRDQTTIEPAIFQQVYYGTVPDDPKLFTRSAANYFQDSPRAFAILEQSPDRVVVESTSSPMVNAVGVLTNVTSKVRYEISSTGQMLIRSETSVHANQSIDSWVCATIGLGDPTSNESVVPPDHVGWIRCTSHQHPYAYSNDNADYIYAFWSPATPPPYKARTKASILLAPHPKNPYRERQFAHNWPGFKRWGYSVEKIQIAPGEPVVQNYFVHLGTVGSPWLPDLSDRAIAAKVWETYRLIGRGR